MRHYMVDPDNEERLLKIPYDVVQRIKEEEREETLNLLSQMELMMTARPMVYHDTVLKVVSREIEPNYILQKRKDNVQSNPSE